MSTVVHHASMYAHQHQAASGPTVLAAVVTPVSGGPATFNGLAPNDLTELSYYSAAGDFSTGSTNAWTAVQWVNLGDHGLYRWDGASNKWVAATLATSVAAGATERAFVGGYWPQTVEQLQSSAFGETTAWSANGTYVCLKYAGNTAQKYYWDGSTNKWVAGAVPDRVLDAPTSVAGTNGVGQSVLTWTAAASNGGTAVTDWQISVFASDGTSAATGVTGALVRLKGSTPTGYTFTGLTGSTGYKFKVAAVNAAGVGAVGTSATVTPT